MGFYLGGERQDGAGQAGGVRGVGLQHQLQPFEELLVDGDDILQIDKQHLQGLFVNLVVFLFERHQHLVYHHPHILDVVPLSVDEFNQRKLFADSLFSEFFLEGVSAPIPLDLHYTCELRYGEVVELE